MDIDNIEDLDLTWDVDPRSPKPEVLDESEVIHFDTPVDPAGVHIEHIPHRNPELLAWLIGGLVAIIIVLLSLFIAQAAASPEVKSPQLHRAEHKPLWSYTQYRGQLEKERIALRQMEFKAAQAEYKAARIAAQKKKAREKAAIAAAKAKREAARTAYKQRKKAAKATYSTKGWNNARASWYGSECYGNNTANGTPYNASAWGVAHKSLPFGTKIQIEYNGHTVTAPVFDRGPFVGGRQFDLSAAVARSLGFSGVQTIRWRIVK